MDTLPLLDTLRNCTNHAQRADWLFRCPLSIIGRDHADIAAVLAADQCDAGIVYLQAELAGVLAVRNRDGTLPFTIAFSINLARVDLEIVARAAEV